MRVTFWPAPIGLDATPAIGFAAALLLLASVPREGANAQTAVDLQLVLAVDVSGSVNAQRFELQKMGYVAAFQNQRVLSAILGGRNQSIAVTMMQWSGPFLQSQVVPWTVLKDESAVKGFAGAIESAPRMMYGGGTSISGAIDNAVTLFPQAPFKAERRVIDVSGDGSNNRGRSVTQARDEAVDAGIVINGLPILAFEPLARPVLQGLRDRRPRRFHDRRQELRDVRGSDPDEADHRDRRSRAARTHAQGRRRSAGKR